MQKNKTFHPIASIPEPKIYAASRVPFVNTLLRGDLTTTTQRLHKQYGEIVRIAPDELSYCSAEAWKDIYGHRQGHPQMQKDPLTFSKPANLPPSIITADDATHARYRRLISNAFSEKAMREQEPLIQTYVDLLIQRLRENCGDKPIDMVKWYNWTTFDILGDLAFGESFHSLENSAYHPWVSLIFDSIKAVSFMTSAKRFPPLDGLLIRLTPKHLLEKRDSHQRLVKEKVAKRMEQQSDRPDFMSAIMKNNDGKGMTLPEITSNAGPMIIAGSETTATLLQGATYYLLSNPAALNKLTTEVREAFAKEEEITLQSVGKLKYLLAVLDESLRMYPPIPSGLPRRVGPEGNTICGRFVSPGTAVSVNQYTTYHSPTNFIEPNSFIPERFLGDPKFDLDKKDALQPFSVGPRNCLGRNLAYAEMRLILARVIWNFDMELAEDSRHWDQQKIYIIWQKNPLHVSLKQRTS